MPIHSWDSKKSLGCAKPQSKRTHKTLQSSLRRPTFHRCEALQQRHRFDGVQKREVEHVPR